MIGHLGEFGFSKTLNNTEALNQLTNEKKIEITNYIADLISTLPLFQSVQDFSELEEIINTAQKFKSFKKMLVLGTGGSSLGGQTLCALKPQEEGMPSIEFLDNIDPYTIASILKTANPNTTGIIAISKSGETSETVIQLLYIIDWFKQNGLEDRLSKQCLIVTTPIVLGKNNTIRTLGEKYGITVLDHHPEIGGRYSIFTCVGLLPAYLHGIDIHKVKEGALDILKLFKNDPEIVIKGGLECYYLAKQSKTLSVFMPYCDRLAFFSLWYRQLAAESLGKGGFGLTPINALGTVDQHSQLQLYLDGPKDKFFTIIGLKSQEQSASNKLNKLNCPDVPAYHNKSMGQLIDAHQKGTLDTFKNLGLPVRYIELDQLNEFAMGQLLMYFILEILVIAKCANVNPFDQEAVEQSKKLARDYFQQA